MTGHEKPAVHTGAHAGARHRAGGDAQGDALRPARVRVPCSTSNLGPGFDTLGLALSLYLDASFDPDPSEDGALRLQREGTLSALTEPVADDLLSDAFTAVLRAHGAEPRGTLTARSEAPLGRGLGSSAMALVAGHALARAALGLQEEPAAAFQAAAEREGHGDNAAPCAFGGLQAVVPGADGLRALRLPLAESVGFAYAAPAHRISTEAARAALPATVSHEDAVEGHAALTALLQGLATGDGELLRIGVRDTLHVPYRLPLIPRGREAMAAATDSGAWAVTVSGSGSGLIALCPPERAQSVADAMAAVFRDGVPDPADTWGLALRPDLVGVRVVG